ncbi:NAD(+)/NADH kinase [Desertimonas flava]|jgi:NAD+ kinase|uniref:NAD(+)/NADH kinase n=1 Tax=Desertimonas flava TaxID=2064846 RepID=UPI0013C4472C|nr:NAD(+)/NADH kinase [Desertimonas flava]
MTRVAVCAHHERPEVVELIEGLMKWLADNGHEGWVIDDDGDELGLAHLAADRPLADADLVISLGGDGTMLRAVGALEGAAVPLLGVNLGQLGYLTEVEPADLNDAVARFVAGSEAGGWHLDERLMLHIDVLRGGERRGTWRALNEVVVERSAAGHTVRLIARIDGEPFTSYAADGLIVSTPTGSTAYSLSARGPIVSPRHRALLLTPVSPHMLFDRTLVLDPSEVVDIEVAGHRRAEVCVDGRVVITADAGDVVSCRPAEATARFVRFGPYRYHQILKSKFGLADR